MAGYIPIIGANPAVFVGEKLSHLIVDMSIIDPRMMGPGPVEFGAH